MLINMTLWSSAVDVDVNVDVDVDTDGDMDVDVPVALVLSGTAQYLSNNIMCLFKCQSGQSHHPAVAVASSCEM